VRALLAATLLVGGCGDEEFAQLVVLVRSDVPTDVIDNIAVFAMTPSGGFVDGEKTLDATDGFPISAGILRGAGADLGPVDIGYNALRGEDLVALDFVTTRFTPGETRLVVFDILEPCAGVSCIDDTICILGQCVDPFDMETPEFDGTLPELDVCNGRDEDGNGRDGDAVDFLTNRDHCGGCDQPCNGVCVEGVCRPGAVTSIGAGIFSTCALHGDGGAITCWGANAEGELGNNDGLVESTGQPRPVTFQDPARQMAVGFAHVCYLDLENRIACFGHNFFGQCGQPGEFSFFSPELVEGLTSVRVVEAGLFHTCVILMNGSLHCWGNNEYGQIGVDPMLVRKTHAPQNIAMVPDAMAVAAGGAQTCALRASGAVVCWGALALVGPMGEYETVVTDAVAIDAGAQHTCAVLRSGEVRCWGVNTTGVLGSLSLTDSLSPVTVSGLPSMSVVSAGVMQNVIGGGTTVTHDGHMCGLSRTNEVWCWGRSDQGQTGMVSELPLLPRHVEGLDGASVIAAGGQHTCALVGSQVLCLGGNDRGQRGEWTMFGEPTGIPVPVRDP
jgi:alpha-tubulin suppressor-like RCC1 family protein